MNPISKSILSVLDYHSNSILTSRFLLPSVQWAAVMMWVSSMTVPPQKTKFEPLLVRAACHGIECFTAFSPPTILSSTTSLSPHPKVPVGNFCFSHTANIFFGIQSTNLELGPKHKEWTLFQLIFYP